MPQTLRELYKGQKLAGLQSSALCPSSQVNWPLGLATGDMPFVRVGTLQKAQ